MEKNATVFRVVDFGGDVIEVLTSEARHAPDLDSESDCIYTYRYTFESGEVHEELSGVSLREAMQAAMQQLSIEVSMSEFAVKVG